MSSRKISQRDARMYMKRVDALEQVLRQQKNLWSGEWPGGVNIVTISPSSETFAIVDTARRLGHAVVCVTKSDKTIAIFGVKL